MPGCHASGLLVSVSWWCFLFPGARFLSCCDFALSPHRVRDNAKFDMYVGLVNLKVAGSHTQWFEVNKVILHDTYGVYHPIGGDIALVQLKTRIVFSDSVLPVCIASPNATLTNLICWSTGWGLISPKGKRTKCRVSPFIGAYTRRHHALMALQERKSLTGLQLPGD